MIYVVVIEVALTITVMADVLVEVVVTSDVVANLFIPVVVVALTVGGALSISNSDTCIQ